MFAVEKRLVQISNDHLSNKITMIMMSKMPTELPPIQMALPRIGNNSKCISLMSCDGWIFD